MRTISAVFGICLVLLAFDLPRLSASELTGSYHKAVGMVQPAYLEIDGPGFVQKIELDDSSLKGVPDGQRLWVKGEITTDLQGSPAHEKSQQQPTQWIVRITVRQWKPIQARFNRPGDTPSPQKSREDNRAPLVVLSGSNSAVTKGDCLRLTSEEEWAAVWNRHAAAHAKSASGLPIQQMPVVDFKSCMVVAIFSGATWNTAGLEFVTSSETDEEIAIGADWLAYQSMEEADKVTPFAFLVLPRSAKPLRLQMDARGLRERAEGLPPIWNELHRFPQLKQENSP